MTALISVHHPWIDSSRAPLYLLSFPESTTDDELHACCAAREAWAAQAHYSVAWVVDLSAIRTATPRQRQIFGQHLVRVEQHNIAYNRGSALIVPSPVLRGVVTAVFWIRPPSFPYRLFATREEGLSWARQQLAHVFADRPGSQG